jgi:hypothetical protein
MESTPSPALSQCATNAFWHRVREFSARRARLGREKHALGREKHALGSADAAAVVRKAGGVAQRPLPRSGDGDRAICEENATLHEHSKERLRNVRVPHRARLEKVVMGRELETMGHELETKMGRKLETMVDHALVHCRQLHFLRHLHCRQLHDHALARPAIDILRHLPPI